ncbi:hypothetical protein ACM42_08285 [Bradyrhizobium sp. CCBAU 25338]|nr:hypothetical protein [Bradyrhizobium sp. CCBAU 25338]
MDHQLTSALASDNAKKRVAGCYADRCGQFQPLNSLIHRASGIDGAKRIVAMEVSARTKYAAKNQTLLVIIQFPRRPTSCSQALLERHAEGLQSSECGWSAKI